MSKHTSMKYSRPEGIPVAAWQYYFQGNNGKSGPYWLWDSGEKWQWQAKGNCGEEPTFAEAATTARRWIRDSQ